MALKVAGVAFGLFVCYAVYLVVVAVIQRYKRKPIFTIHRKGRLVQMTTSLEDVELKEGDQIGQAKVRWRYNLPNPIDGMRSRTRESSP